MRLPARDLNHVAAVEDKCLTRTVQPFWCNQYKVRVYIVGYLQACINDADMVIFVWEPVFNLMTIRKRWLSSNWGPSDRGEYETESWPHYQLSSPYILPHLFLFASISSFWTHVVLYTVFITGGWKFIERIGRSLRVWIKLMIHMIHSCFRSNPMNYLYIFRIPCSIIPTVIKIIANMNWRLLPEVAGRSLCNRQLIWQKVNVMLPSLASFMISNMIM